MGPRFKSHPFRQSPMFPPPPWQVWVGIALLMLVAVAALVSHDRDPRAPSTLVGWEAEAPLFVTERLEEILDAIERPSGLELRPVVDLTYRETRYVRLRPFLDGLELRGADLRVEWTVDSSVGTTASGRAQGRGDVSVDFDPWPASWTAVNALAATGQTVSRAAPDAWWSQVGLQAAQSELSRTTVRPFIALENGRAPQLLVEVGADLTGAASRQQSALARAWDTLPWEGQPAPLAGPPLARVRTRRLRRPRRGA